MLTVQQRHIIAATAPVVAQHITTITTQFYPAMFDRYPEIKPRFNPRHQQTGAQPRALGQSIVAYAMNYDDPTARDAVLAPITHKHVALHVKPDHYRIVGECLLEAAAEVLGEAFTPDVRDAWQALYWSMADDLIDGEERLYHDQERRPGGWRGFRAFRVMDRQAAAEGILSVTLTPADGLPLADFLPGQYIGLRLEHDGHLHYRQYSLTGQPGSATYRITVKEEARGQISQAIHHGLTAGQSVHLTAPIGLLTLDRRTTPVVLLSAGIGQTPMLSLARQALAQGRQVTYLHSTRSPATLVFREELESLHAEYGDQLRVIHRFSHEAPAGESTGRIDRALLGDVITGEEVPDCYFTGPSGFMSDINALLEERGIPETHRHYECFGPLQLPTS